MLKARGLSNLVLAIFVFALWVYALPYGDVNAHSPSSGTSHSYQHHSAYHVSPHQKRVPVWSGILSRDVERPYSISGTTQANEVAGPLLQRRRKHRHPHGGKHDHGREEEGADEDNGNDHGHSFNADERVESSRDDEETEEEEDVEDANEDTRQSNASSISSYDDDTASASDHLATGGGVGHQEGSGSSNEHYQTYDDEENSSAGTHRPAGSIESGHADASTCQILRDIYDQLDGSNWWNRDGWRGNTGETTNKHSITGPNHQKRTIRLSIRNHDREDSEEDGSENERDEYEHDENDSDESVTQNEREEGDNEGYDHRDDFRANDNEDNEADGKGNCCSWFGVTCHKSRIIGLELPQNGLSGMFPERLFDLVDLQILNLSYNNFPSTLPDQFSRTRSLIAIDIRHSNLTSAADSGAPSFPSTLGTLPFLANVHLEGNSLRGRADFSGAPVLENLFLSGNVLGTNGLKINPGSTVKKVVARSCQIQSDLATIGLSGNALAGLEVLDLQRNEIFGTLPDLEKTYPGMNILDLSFNELVGSFPTTFPPQLHTLRLAHNSISGAFPSMPAPESLVKCVMLPNLIQACPNEAECNNPASLAGRCSVRCKLKPLPTNEANNQNLQPQMNSTGPSEEPPIDHEGEAPTLNLPPSFAHGLDSAQSVGNRQNFINNTNRTPDGPHVSDTKNELESEGSPQLRSSGAWDAGGVEGEYGLRRKPEEEKFVSGPPAELRRDDFPQGTPFDAQSLNPIGDVPEASPPSFTRNREGEYTHNTSSSSTAVPLSQSSVSSDISQGSSSMLQGIPEGTDVQAASPSSGKLDISRDPNMRNNMKALDWGLGGTRVRNSLGTKVLDEKQVDQQLGDNLERTREDWSKRRWVLYAARGVRLRQKLRRSAQ